MGKPIIDINGATREMTDAEYAVYLAGQEQEPELTAIEKLKAENVKLNEMLAQTNADFAGFMDYYFSVNPE